MSQAVTGRERSVLADFFNDPSVMPATVAQQIFSVVPGIAGGIAGFILAAKLANARKVNTSGVLVASVLNAALTIGTIWLITEAVSDEITS